MKRLVIVFYCLTLLIACGGGGGGGSDTAKKDDTTPPPPPAENSAPSLTVSSPASVQELSVVTVNANASDSDGQISSIDWQQTAGPTVVLTLDATAKTASFTAPQVSMSDVKKVLSFDVTATDDDGDFIKKSVSLTVEAVNAAPFFNITHDQSIGEGKLVALTANADDADGEIISYLWSTAIENNINIVNGSSKNASFQAPVVTKTTDYTFTVEATDNEGSKAFQNIVVTVNPTVQGELFYRPQAVEAAQAILAASFSHSKTAIVVEDDLLPYRVEVFDTNNSKLGEAVSLDSENFNVEVNGNLAGGFYIKSSHRSYRQKLIKDENGEVVYDEFTEEALKAFTEGGAPILEAFYVADIEAICDIESKYTCNATPFTTVISKTGRLTGSINVVDALPIVEQHLNFELTSDPFLVEQIPAGINFSAIETVIDNGNGTISWVDAVMDFLNGSRADINMITEQFIMSNETRLELTTEAGVLVNSYEIVDIEAQASFLGDDADQLIMNGLNYSWTINYPNGSIEQGCNGLNTNAISFKAPAVLQKDFIFVSVTVNSGDFSETKSITVVVDPAPAPENTAPAIEQMQDMIVSSGDTVDLAAVVSDGEDFSCNITHSWTQISGPTVTLSNENAASPSFVAPNTADEVIALTFELSVTDSGDQTISTPVDIYVTKQVNVGNFALNDTGVTKCANYAFGSLNTAGHDNQIDCENNDNLLPLPQMQDAMVGRDANQNSNADGSAGFSFTKIAADGSELDHDASQWTCVVDNVTGLMWENKSTEESLQNKNMVFTHFNSDQSTNAGMQGIEQSEYCQEAETCFNSESFVEAVNSQEQSLCGYSDWRLPTRMELHSLVDYSGGTSKNGKPRIVEQFFPNTVLEHYMTSSHAGEKRTPDLYENRKLWVVSFIDGQLALWNTTYNVTDSRLPIRLVRK
ncbi:DUF1566 domain-containing protein [Thalassotalea fonticola]|uniref:DUF1566 domain-containing protein n=1 Tax=Thalassotalea fonticola TaxID=3065649 RepID=A0ABZ0GT77_9GAMM|nr:DUF1566 domain-containing protein [Colwelliaceae bacterium S1-1]